MRSRLMRTVSGVPSMAAIPSVAVNASGAGPVSR